MSDTVEAENPMFVGKSAVILAGVFLAIYVIFALLCAVDRGQRAKLEQMTPLSSVGRPATITPPQLQSSTSATEVIPRSILMIRGGIPLSLTQRNVQLRFVRFERALDFAMRKVGTDDMGRVMLYRHNYDDVTFFNEGTYAKLRGSGSYALLGEEKYLCYSDPLRLGY